MGRRILANVLGPVLLSGFLAGMFYLSAVHAQTSPASSTERNPRRGVLYASAGCHLTQYDLDAKYALLVIRTSIRLPPIIQYAWTLPSPKYFYIAWSDGRTSTAPTRTASIPRGKLHGISAFRIHPQTGA